MSFEEILIIGVLAAGYWFVIQWLLSMLVPHMQSLFVEWMTETAKEIKQAMKVFLAIEEEAKSNYSVTDPEPYGRKAAKLVSKLERAREEHSRCIFQRGKLFRRVPSHPENQFQCFWFVFLLKPYHWVCLCWGARMHRTSVQSLQPANIEPVQAVLEQLRDMPIIVGERVRVAGETANQVSRIKQFLCEKGMRGETIDTVVGRIQELEKHLEEVSPRLLLAPEALRKELASNRKAIKKGTMHAWAILKAVEDPLRQLLKLLKEWQARYYEAGSAVQKVSRAVENTHQQLEEVPKSIDIHRETAELERLATAAQGMARRYLSPTVEELTHLLEQAPEVTRSSNDLMKLSVSVKQQFSHLSETIDSNTALLKQITEQMVQITEADKHPLVWQQSKTRLVQLRELEVSIGTIEKRRTLMQLETHLEMAGKLGRHAQALCRRVINVRRQWDALTQLLEGPEITSGLGWVNKAEDLQPRVAEYDPENWGDDRFTTILIEARSLASQQQALELANLESSIQEEQLEAHLEETEVLVKQLGEFQARLQRIERILRWLQQQEQRAQQRLQATLGALERLDMPGLELAPSSIIEHCEQVIALVEQGQEMGLKLEQRADGKVQDKVDKVDFWAQLCEDIVRDLNKKLEAESKDAKTRLGGTVEQLHTLASLSREPAVVEARQLVWVPFAFSRPSVISLGRRGQIEQLVVQASNLSGDLEKSLRYEKTLLRMESQTRGVLERLNSVYQEALRRLQDLIKEKDAESDWPPITFDLRDIESQWQIAEGDWEELGESDTIQVLYARTAALRQRYERIVQQVIRRRAEIDDQRETLRITQGQIDRRVNDLQNFLERHQQDLDIVEAIQERLEQVIGRLEEIQLRHRYAPLSHKEAVSILKEISEIASRTELRYKSKAFNIHFGGDAIGVAIDGARIEADSIAREIYES